MYLLNGHLQRYSWGSDTALPKILGLPSDGQPLAEVWFGAHPQGPASVQMPLNFTFASSSSQVTQVPLDVFLANNPADALGWDVSRQHGQRLPYLLKLIAPTHTLSLQVHPKSQAAAAGYEREKNSGVAAGKARNYSDPWHKPELLYALDKFEAMCGFRAPRRAAELLQGLKVPLAQKLGEILQTSPSSSGMRLAFETLFGSSDPVSSSAVTELVEACRRRLLDGSSPSKRADATVALLADSYPQDPAVVMPLLLNPVSLQAGEALFVPAGAIHAYLSGTAVEIMTASNNVLRAGLTAKHIDLDEFISCVDFTAAPPVRIAPEFIDANSCVFYAPVDEFELGVIRIGDLSGANLKIGDIDLASCQRLTLGRAYPDHCTLPGRGGRIVVCLTGAASLQTLAGRGQKLPLSAGQAAFLLASDGPVTASGTGVFILADVP